jgi:hypothetical protein
VLLISIIDVEFLPTHFLPQLGHEIGDITVVIIEQDKDSPYKRVLFKFDANYEEVVGDKTAGTSSFYTSRFTSFHIPTSYDCFDIETFFILFL